jgi:hypothetical protein
MTLTRGEITGSVNLNSLTMQQNNQINGEGAIYLNLEAVTINNFLISANNGTSLIVLDL